MSSDELLNSGDCEHSLYLGCRHCDVCEVEEFAKRQIQIEKEEEQAYLRARIAMYDRGGF